MKNKKGESTIIIILGIIFVITIIGYLLLQAFTNGTENIIIKEKWVKYQRSGAKYLVSSEKGEVYEITDSWLYWRWNSSDLYAYLQNGMNCSIKYQGFRFPFMSDYKNIIEAKC